MTKFLLLAHRYLGIGLSLILLLWCLSGFVMMYKPYPELSLEQQLETLEALDFSSCCTPVPADEGDLELYDQFYLLMINGEPTLHLYSGFGYLDTVNLHSGEQYQTIPEAEALEISRRYAEHHQYPEPTLLDSMENDQWTVYGSYNPHRPLYRFSANDAAGTQWYVSSRSGEIVQIVTREQRIWGYLGAVIHWLYPTRLRERAALWNQTVIWLSTLGTFLTLTGIYFGIKHYRLRKNGRRSPFHGWMLWHHYTGLIFGLMTLTWVISGLFSMQPWGLFEPTGAGAENNRLMGGSLSMNTINDTLARLSDFAMDEDTVLLEGKKIGGVYYLTTYDADLNKTLYRGMSMSPATLTTPELIDLAQTMLNGQNLLFSALLYQEDAYYYSHHNAVSLPVFKIIADNPDRTIYYLDPVDASIQAKYDSGNRGFRWFHLGLHRLDFFPALRSRPAWDILMWILLSGVTIGIFTGVVISFRRLKYNFQTRQ